MGRVSRLARDKDVDVFVRAAARVARRASGVWFVVCGDGDARRELEELAEEVRESLPPVAGEGAGGHEKKDKAWRAPARWDPVSPFRGRRGRGVRPAT